jgi:hypothetical protein
MGPAYSAEIAGPAGRRIAEFAMLGRQALADAPREFLLVSWDGGMGNYAFGSDIAELWRSSANREVGTVLDLKALGRRLAQHVKLSERKGASK